MMTTQTHAYHATTAAPAPRNFTELTDRTSWLLAHDDWQGALRLAEQGRDLAGRTPATFALWHAALLWRSGAREAAVADLQRAFAEGAWWHPRLMLEHPEYAPLAADPACRALLDASEQRWHSAQTLTEAQATPAVVRMPAGRPRAMLLAMHGVNSLARAFAAMWMRAARANDLALVAPQSPMITSSDGLFGWQPEHAHQDVLSAYEAAVADHEELADVPVVLAGFSQGGGLAATWSLTGKVPSIGFVVAAPAALPVTPAHVDRAAARGLRGSLMVGEWDWARERTERFFSEQLQPRGLRSRFEVMPSVAHSVSSDFASRVDAALQFVLDV